MPRTIGLFIFLQFLLWPFLAQSATLRGTTYLDLNQNAASNFCPNRDIFDNPMSGQTVHLFDGQTEMQQVTDENGGFAFTGLAPGYYFIHTDVGANHICTTKNRALRTTAAILEGELNIVTYGDSIGVYGSDHPYPERLAEHFAALTEVTLNNLAVTGSQSWDWLPGSEAGYFEDRVATTAPDADLITITLGGNDLIAYIEGMPPYDFWQVILNLLEHPEYLFGIGANIRAFIDEIRSLNPDCDIVYVIYPNFGNSSYLVQYIGEELQPFAAALIGFGLTMVRADVGQHQPIIIADMFGMLRDTWLDPYLMDFVHPSEAGHQLYADNIFITLGGAYVGQHTLGYIRHYGFFTPTTEEIMAP